MMSRGTSSPVCVRRKPVSMSCPASVRISITSPRFAEAGTLTMTRAAISRVAFSYKPVLEAGRKGNNDFHAVRPERTVAHLRDRGDRSGVGDARARGDGGAPGARAEPGADDVRLRVFLGEHVDHLHVI